MTSRGAFVDPSFLDAAAELLRRAPRRPWRIAAVLCAAVASYCVGHTLIVGGTVDPGLSAAWAASIVVPWVVAWWVLQVGARHVVVAAAVLGIAALGSAVLERASALAFGVDDGTRFAELVFRRVPVWGALVAMNALRHRARTARAPVVDDPFADVHWVKAAENYLELHGAGRSQLVRRTLASFAADPQAAQFVRIHRSLLVHRGRVAGLERGPRGQLAVRLHDGTVLGVGRSYRAAVEQALG